MAPSWIRFMVSDPLGVWWRRCVPATMARPFSCASLAASITSLQPATSVATGFSVKTCLPALMAAINCRPRNAGVVAISSRSASHLASFSWQSKPQNR